MKRRPWLSGRALKAVKPGGWKRRLPWLPLAILPFALLIALLVFALAQQEAERHAVDKHLQILQTEYTATQQMFLLSSEVYVTETLRNPELMHQLAAGLMAATPKVAEASRQAVLASLLPSFVHMRDHSVSQMHLVRPDGTSFLRLHKPEEYDDQIASVRPLLKQALAEQHSMFGFELGRHSPAFEYIYPLHSEGAFLGLIDLSIPFRQVETQLRGLDPESDFAFVLDQHVFDAGILNAGLEGFAPFVAGSGWLVGRGNSGVGQNANASRLAQKCNLQLATDTHFQQALDRRHSFAQALYLDDGAYIVSMLRIADHGGRPAGYLASYVAAPRLLDFQYEFWRNEIIAFFLLSGLAFVMWRFLKNQQRLADERAMFKSISEAMLDGLYVTDTQGRVTVANPAAAALLGCRQEELIGAPVERLVGESEAELAPGLCEKTFRRCDGSAFPVSLSRAPLHTSNGVFEGTVSVFRNISEAKAHEAYLEHLAHFDPLTGLPIRAKIVKQLESAFELAQKTHQQVAFLLISLSGFKVINDSFGHDSGDFLLKHLAERLSVLSEGEMLGRWGGSEFTLIMQQMLHVQDAEQAAEYLAQLLETPFILENGQEVFVGGQVGISLFPKDGDTAAAIIRNADSALHQAKLAGPSAWRVYTHSLTESARRRLELDTLMRRGLERKEFELFYQPLVSAQHNTLVGVEVLVRWQHPEMGMVSPGQFIPVAEQTGFIVALGDWILQTACEQFVAWQRAGKTLPMMAVNLSPRQFQQRDLVSRLKEVLANTGMPASHLELEITEGAMMNNTEAAISLLENLKALGVQMAIDDFGTGYSSLSYLKRFPVDKLKIDQSFVRGLPDDHDDANIARTVQAMGRALGLEVLAEGVETKEQAAFLRELGCDTLQGYLFSRPVPANLLEAMLDEKSRPEAANLH